MILQMALGQHAQTGKFWLYVLLSDGQMIAYDDQFDTAAEAVEAAPKAGEELMRALAEGIALPDGDVVMLAPTQPGSSA